MLQFNFNWDKLSVSAGLTLRNVYFRLYPGAIGELEVIDFLKALVHHLEPPNVCPKDYGELNERARKALRRMRRKPRLITAFWKQSSLCFD